MLWSRYKTALIALLAVSLIGGVVRAEVTVEENVTYGKGGETELTLDIARPDGDGPFQQSCSSTVAAGIREVVTDTGGRSWKLPSEATWQRRSATG